MTEHPELSTVVKEHMQEYHSIIDSNEEDHIKIKNAKQLLKDLTAKVKGGDYDDAELLYVTEAFSTLDRYLQTEGITLEQLTMISATAEDYHNYCDRKGIKILKSEFKKIFQE